MINLTERERLALEKILRAELRAYISNSPARILTQTDEVDAAVTAMKKIAPPKPTARRTAARP